MDTDWYLMINHFASDTPWLHRIAAQYALWGGLVLLVVLVVVGWLWARHRPDAPDRVAIAVLTGVSAVVVLVVNQHLISPTIARPRPCHTLHGVEVLLKCTQDYSMPSDHCIVAGAIIAGSWILARKFGVVATILGLLLAFSRVYVGVHYPSDTVVGLLIGAAIGVVIVLALRRPMRALCARLESAPVSLLVRARQRNSQKLVATHVKRSRDA